MLRLILICINMLVGVMLILLSIAWYRISPLTSMVLLAASIDQFEDVFFLATGKSLFPRFLAGFDVGAEIAQFVLGIAIFLFGASYVNRLEYAAIPYFTIIMGLAVCFSAMYDIASIPDRYPLARMRGMMLHEEGHKRRRVLRTA